MPAIDTGDGDSASGSRAGVHGQELDGQVGAAAARDPALGRNAERGHELAGDVHAASRTLHAILDVDEPQIQLRVLGQPEAPQRRVERVVVAVGGDGKMYV